MPLLGDILSGILENKGGSTPQAGAPAPASGSGGSGVLGAAASVGLGLATGGVSIAVQAAIKLLPVLIGAVSGMFKDHSPEFLFDNGCDKMHQYYPYGAIPGWFQPQINNARAGLKGLITQNKFSYAGGAPLYYLPFLAFPIVFTNKLGQVEKYDGDDTLQELAASYYAQGLLPTEYMIFNGRIDYDITTYIPLMKATKYYQSWEAAHPLENISNNLAADVKTGFAKYWPAFLLIPAGLLFFIIRKFVR